MMKAENRAYRLDRENGVVDLPIRAGGLWFSPGAFQHDAMMVLHGPERGARPEPSRTSASAGAA